ncbi:MAG: hypothetical protein HYZ42_09770 [Bacteroidetes bacterium]|nr:hypothetical protein [Bacteroidota bacterium]
MAQLLVSIEDVWYQAIASIRNYSEPDFEEKIFKYSSDIFKNFYTVKFKYDIVNKTSRSEKCQPDLLIISKDFKRWIFIEVELCNKPLTHTKKQIRCFLNPEFDSTLAVDFLVRQNPYLAGNSMDLLNLIENTPPELLMIYDDYCHATFSKLLADFPKLKICILETYRTPLHECEAYRLSGDYPYEVSFISKLAYKDEQHYKVLKTEIFNGFDEGDVEILYKMKKLKGVILKHPSKNQWFLKIPRNPLPNDIAVQLHLDKDKQLIIQKI